MFDRLATYLDTPRRVLLTTHENPDGDGVGSMLALKHYLQSRGSEVRIVITPSLPHFLEWLDPEGWIEAYDPDGVHAQLAAWPDLWILVDASEAHRLGVMLTPFQATPAQKACIDHHLKDSPQGFDHEFTDRSAAASAEIVFDLALGRMPEPWPRAMVDALYTGLVEDTGNFRHSNSSPKVHRQAAHLISAGAEASRTYQNLYFQGRPERLRIFGRAFDSLRLLASGTIGCFALTQADFRETGAHHDDLENLVNVPLELRGVEVSCLLTELPDGRVKLSLRSRGRVDVNAVCRKFSGGGHRLASGAKLEGPLARAMERVDATLIEQVAADLSRH